MSFQNMLDKECSIYKANEHEGNLGYGLPQNEEVTYPTTPSFTGVPTTTSGEEFFTGDIGAGIVNTSRVKFFFLPLQSIGVGDIVELEGAYYRAEEPNRIRNHHIEVFCVRGDNFKWLVQG